MLNHRFFALCALFCLVALSFSDTVFGQTDSQTLRVQVPTRISIEAPAAVKIRHDETDNDQVFPGQLWSVKANNPAGVSISFSTNKPFTHKELPEFMRDAKINLSVDSSEGPATWNITQSSDVTNYQAADPIATVSATSNGVGIATMNLEVTFITDNFGTFVEGRYITKVTGTVTAN